MSESPAKLADATVTSNKPSAHGSARLAAVDGLRAVAVAGVIGYHFGWGPQNGLLGVDLFFVISGFVITLVLLRERQLHGRNDFSAFWKRRVRRIFPLVAVVLLAVTAWSWLASETVSASFRIAAAQSSLFALVSGLNWWQIFGGGGYWGLAAESNPLTHLWSLAIEEQFYLLYPFLFVFLAVKLPRKYRGFAVLGLAVLAYVWGVCFTLFGEPSADRVYLGTDTRVGALLLGAAVAFWLADRAGGAGRPPRALRIAAPFVFVALISLWVVSDSGLPHLSTIVLPLSGMLSALLVGALAWDNETSSGFDGGFARLLGARPLVYIGRLSYSLYLWHWVVWVFLAQSVLVGRAVTPWIALGVSVALSVLTYHFIEQPILRRSWTWRGLLLLCAPVFIAVAVAGWVTLATVEPPTSQEAPTVEVFTG